MLQKDLTFDKPVAHVTQKCDVCGQTCKPSALTNGYTIRRDGTLVCFDCCADDDVRTLRDTPPGEHVPGAWYLQENRVHGVYSPTISNWPGTLIIKCAFYRQGKHNIARTRFDVWFKYADAWFWAVQYGKRTQIAHVKKLKHAPV